MNQVEISTKTLTFDLTQNQANLSQSFYIRNFSAEQKAGFKIKSTSSRKFIVNPFTGVIGKSDEVKVSVLLKSKGIDPQELIRKETFAVYFCQIQEGLSNQAEILEFIQKNPEKVKKQFIQIDFRYDDGANQQKREMEIQEELPIEQREQLEEQCKSLEENIKQLYQQSKEEKTAKNRLYSLILLFFMAFLLGRFLNNQLFLFIIMFDPTYHQQRRLYYGNHDLVMALRGDLRRGFINTFVALNTPEKLEPEDRERVLRESERLSRFNIPKALALGAVFSAVIFRRPLHIAVSFPLISLGVLSHFNSQSDMNLVQSALMEKIANKYDFSVFDFHDSK